jgi:hypothetical protein
VGGAVEVFTQWPNLDEKVPGELALLGIELADSEVRAEHSLQVGKSHLQRGWNRALGRARVALGREPPAEHLSGEVLEIREDRDRVFFGIKLELLDTGAQEPLPFGVVSVEDGPGAHQSRRRDHEAGRLHEVDPGAVREDIGIDLRSGHQFVSGQR